MEQEIIKGRMLVDLDDPLQHIDNTLVGQPHAEGFIQPHPFRIEQKTRSPQPINVMMITNQGAISSI